MGDIKKVQRTAREQTEILKARYDRLFEVKWQPETGGLRRDAISRCQQRIRYQISWLRSDCIQEEQDELWPNGLPAHP